MTASIVDGHKIAAEIESEIKQGVEKLKQENKTPKLGVIFIGDDPASQTYINKKRKKATELGIEFKLFQYPNSLEGGEIKKEIEKIQKQGFSGLIIQLPIPERIYPDLLDTIDPKLDVDCLTSINFGKLIKNTNHIEPPTAGAVMEIVDRYIDNLEGKKVTIVGTGILVGKPLSCMFMNKNTTLTTCNKYTQDLKTHCKDADILISGVGKKHLITADMVKENSIVIDVGIDYENNKVYGDVDFEKVKKKVKLITPTPGGVGPITVSKLLSNVVKNCKELT